MGRIVVSAPPLCTHISVLTMVDSSDVRQLSAVVLCGGRSRRMGQDKAWLPIGPETFLQRICRTLSGLANQVVVVAAAEQHLPEILTDVVIARDDFPGEGPLGGFLTGLRQLQYRDNFGSNGAVLLTACDAPFINPAVVRFLTRELDGHEAVVIRHAGRLHPLPAVYDAGVANVAQRIFEQGQRRLGALPDQLRLRTVTSQDLASVDPNLRCLWSANTPEELSRMPDPDQHFEDD